MPITCLRLRSYVVSRLVSIMFLGFLISNNVDAQVVQIGSGATTESSFLEQYFRSHHLQVVYSKAELNAAGIYKGNIEKLGFYIESLPGRPVPEFTVKLGHTSARHTSNYLTDTLDRVIYRSTYTPDSANQFDMIQLDTIWYWNGQDNIVVDLCFDQGVKPTTHQSGAIRVYNDSNYRFVSDFSNHSSLCGLPVYSRRYNKPQVKFKFTPRNTNDAGIISIWPSASFCPESTAITTTMANFGTNFLTNATINWSLNGVLQSPVNFSGNLDTIRGSGISMTTLNLGTFTPQSDSSYTISVWTSSPNSTSDPNLSNDTLTITAKTRLKGNYRIGGSGQDYPSFQAAVDDLENYGVCGPVVFEFAPGTYREGVTIHEIYGVDSNSSVTFKSLSGDSSSVILTHQQAWDPSKSVVKIQGGDWIIFKHLTFESTQENLLTISIENNSDQLFFHNCIIKANNFGSPSSTLLIQNYSSDNNRLHLENNWFIGGKGAYAGATKLVFRNNLLTGQHRYGVNTSSNYVIFEKNNLSSLEYYGDSILSIQGNIFHERVIINGNNSLVNARSMIANNFFKKGVRINYVKDLDFFFNTIRYSNLNNSQPALDLLGVDGIRLINNNITSDADIAMSINNPSEVTDATSNNYHTSGSQLIRVNSSSKSYSSLATWNSATGLDSNSFSVSPYFLSDSTYKSAQVSLNNNGIALPAVSVDIEGETRSLTNPDIGADEFTPQIDDAGIIDIRPTIDPMPPGNQQIKAILKNFGNNALTNTTIKWSINGVVQPSVTFSGSLSSGDTTSVILGSYHFLTGSLYEIEAYSSLPNGVSDAFTPNDSTRIDSITPALSGVYTVGGTSPDFTTPSEASKFLQLGGITGWVTFNIRDGIYTSTIIINKPVKGVSATDSIVFQSESGNPNTVIIDNSPNFSQFLHINLFQNLIKNNGFLTFKGITTCLVGLEDSVNDLAFINCKFTRASGHSPGCGIRTVSGAYYLGSATVKNILIKNCLFTQSSFGIEMEGRHNAGLLIEGNQIHTEIILNKFNGPIITNNEASSFDLSNFNGNFQITGNKAFAPNEVYAFKLEGLQGTISERGLFANNFVSSGDNRSSSSIALDVLSCSFLDILHNSVQHGSSSGNAISIGSSTNLDVRNNIFSSTGGGYALSSQGFSGFDHLNHNNYYSTGNSLFYRPNIGSIADLSSWQSVSGLDSNSLSVDPLFLSNQDLHTNQTALNAAGTPLPQVLLDIDGEKRDSVAPDIGADEIQFLPDDLAISSITSPSNKCGLSDSTQISVRIYNFGSLKKSGFEIALFFKGDTLFETVDSVIGGSFLEHTFSKFYDLSLLGNYPLKTWVALVGDTDRSNDTLNINVQNLPKPNFTITADTSICQGEYMTLTATGGAAYFWSNGSSGSAINVSPDSTTTYTVEIITLSGCTVIDSVTIDVFYPTVSPSLMVVGNTTICKDDSLLVYSTDTTGIIWSTGQTVDSIYITKSGRYSLMLNSPGSACHQKVFGEVDVKVGDPSASIVVNGYTQICQGDSVTLSVPGFASGQWSTGDSVSSITVFPTTDSIFSVNFVSNLGCSISDSINIKVVPPVPPSPASNLIPLDGTLNLSKPIIFSWTPGINALSYGIYFWKKSEQRPSSPTKDNLTAINISQSWFEKGEEYYWQVVSKNSCFSTFSDTNEFKVVGTPDLLMDTVIIPSQGLSGKSVNISWRVKNIGEYSTASQTWVDRIYLSTDASLNSADDTLLKTVPNQTYLDTGQSYMTTTSITLPNNIISTALIFVITDNLDAYCDTIGQVCYPGVKRSMSWPSRIQELDEENNFLFDTITISPSPTPDLQITSIGAPTAAFSGDTISMVYTIKNAGNTDLPVGNWLNCLYISQDSFYSPSATYLGTLRSGNPQPMYSTDSSNTFSENVILPSSLVGNYYLHIYADCYQQVFEGGDENNNAGSLLTPIAITLTPPADLLVTSITLPSTGSSGNNLKVSWIVKNAGANPPSPNHWVDSIYLCSSPTFRKSNVVWSGLKGHYGGAILLHDSTYSQTYNIPIPNGVSGSYYLFVKTDAENAVFEYTSENNNRLRSSGQVSIGLSPSPDLVVTSVSLPSVDTLYVDSVINLSWYTLNKGVGSANQSWTDEAYLSPFPSNLGTYPKRLGTILQTNPLNPGDSVYSALSFVVPNYPSGLYYFYIKTDNEDFLYEHFREGNNIAGGQSLDLNGVYLKSKPVVSSSLESDISATTIAAPSSANSGQQISLSWSGINLGPDAVGNISWTDNIYLSTDTVLSNTDTHLSGKSIQGPLANGVSYNASQIITLPNGISGTYYLIIEAVEKPASIGDKTLQNNFISKAITISLTTPPDLEITSVSLPFGNLYAGQQFYIPYTVKNNGPGTITGKNWTESMFLSSSPGLPGTPIGSIGIAKNLIPSSSYSDSILITLPPYANGNYYLLTSTDHLNQVYEHTNENNNLHVQSIFINSASLVQTDLVVSDIPSIDTMLLGHDYILNYEFKNMGSTDARGYHKDAFFLAQSTSYNGATDFQFASTDAGKLLPANDSASFQWSERLTGLNFGSYFGISRLNVKATLPENDLTNNDSTSANPIYVDAESLILSIPDSNTLDFEKPIYYKVMTGSGLDMLVTLTSDQTGSGINEVFVAFGKVPSESHYDFKYNVNSSLNQTVLVPNTQAGTYYIYVKTQSQFPGKQRVQILAETLPYSIIKISPAVVGQGVVTTTISGAGFRPGVKVYLHDSTGTTISTATIRKYKSSMEMDVRWDLSTVPLGNYDVVTENPDSSIARLSRGLEVEPSTGYQINFYALTPNVLRFGPTQDVFSFVYENVGNVDIPFVKADIRFPTYTKVDQLHFTGTGIFSLSDIQKGLSNGNNWHIQNNLTVIPILAKDLSPNESVSLNATLRNFLFAEFPYQMRTKTLSTEDFLQIQAYLADNFRQGMLNMQNSISDPTAIALAYDKKGFQDSIMAHYISVGIISPMDTMGVDIDCSNCPGHYTISPSIGPGTEYHNNLKLSENENMLWEINLPSGTPGQHPGWDLVKANGTITIASTASNPFQIDLVSLNVINNQPDFLSGFSPGYDIQWPIMVADNGIVGFDSAKFSIDAGGLIAFNNIYNGHFELAISSTNDTIYLVFKAGTPAPGQAGYPGNDSYVGPPGKGGPPGVPTPQNPNPPKGTTGKKKNPEGPDGPVVINDPNDPNNSSSNPNNPNNGGSPSSISDTRRTPRPCEPRPILKGQQLCKDFEEFNDKTGCGQAVIGCALNIPTLALGPWGVAYFVASCGTGIYNCNSPTGGTTTTKILGCVFSGIDYIRGGYLNKLSDQLAGGAGLSMCAAQLICAGIPVISSCDPNEIHGPVGYGTERFVRADTAMPYTIYFENDSSIASATAQRVTIRQKIDPNMNPYSFKLKEFGFGKYTFQVPGNVPNYSTTLDLTDSLGVDVQLTAGVDVVNGEFFWIFQSIDKGTGLPPYDPVAGFLAINDNLGSGEGFVKYTVNPQPTVTTGDTITAQAEIVFDVNSLIETNTEVHIIDALPPATVLDSLPPYQDSTSFPISWHGSDDVGGSGISGYYLLASENGAGYYPYVGPYQDTTVWFTGQDNSTYSFLVLGIDNVGNLEVKDSLEGFTTINTTGFAFYTFIDTAACAGSNLQISWNSGKADSLNLSFKAINDSIWNLIDRFDTSQSPFTWNIPDSLAGGFYHLRLSDTTDREAFSDTLQIYALPTIRLMNDTAICRGDSLQLSVSGGASYNWLSGREVSDSTVSNPMVSPMANQYFAVRVANEAGCYRTDSILVQVLERDTMYVSANTCAQSQAGITTDSYFNAAGCDSIVITNTVLRAEYSDTLVPITVCPGDSVLIFSKYRSMSGNYYDSLSSAYSCDSIVVQELIVNSQSNVTLPALSICSGDSAMVFGKYRTSSGLYMDSLLSSTGCDSVVSLSLLVQQSNTLTQSASICSGDSVLLAGAWQTTAGTFVDTLISSFGCDSILTTNLNVNSIAMQQVTQSFCKGDSVLIAGAWKNTPGVYSDTLISIIGCDSVVKTTLSMIIVDTSVSLQNGQITASALSAGYKWIDCVTGLFIPNQTGRSFTPTTNGIYSVQVTKSGCIDTSRCVVIDDIGQSENALGQISVHPNPTTSKVTIELGQIFGSIKISVIDGSGKIVTKNSFAGRDECEVDLSKFASGTYHLHIRTDGGEKIVKVVKE